MKRISYKLLLASLVLTSPAWADQTINQLNPAGPLSGTELIPVFQNSIPALVTTPLAISTYIGSSHGTVTPSTIGQIPVYTGASTVTGSPNLTFSSGMLVINTNTSPVPGFTGSQPLLAIVAPNTVSAKIGLASYGANSGSGVTAANAAGTGVSPLPLASGTRIGAYNWAPYDSTGFVNSARIDAITAENMGPTAHGTAIVFGTTAIGSTVLTDRLTIENDGGVTSPGVPGGDKGPGTINVAGLFVNGSAVGGGGGGIVSPGSIGQIPIYSASTTVTGSPNFTLSGGLLTFNTNALLSIPTFTGQPIFTISAPDGVTARIGLVTYGNASGSGVTAASVGGTNSARTALTSGTRIGAYNWAPYDGVGMFNSARIDAITAENMITSAHGTAIVFSTTPVGSTTMADVFRMEADGGITVPPTVAGGDKGPGTINMAGCYVNGVACGGGGGSGTVASSSVGQIPVYTAATTVTGSPNFTFSSNLLTLNTNAVLSFPTFTGTQPLLTMVGPDAGSTKLGLVSFGTASGSGITAANVGGTNSSRAALTSGTRVGAYNWAPYDGVSLVNSARVDAITRENMTSIAHGTAIAFGTTPIGSTTLADAMFIESDGGIVTPGVTGGSKGFGTINVAGCFINNVPCAAGGSGAVGSGTGPQIAQYPGGTGTSVNGVTMSGDATIANGGAVTISNNVVTNAKLATALANTIHGNFTNSTANHADNAMPSCPDSGGNHLNYVNGTGITCGTSGGGSSSLVVGTTTITSGTNYGILYNNVGVLGNSGVLTLNMPILGGGSSGPPTAGTISGNTTKLVTQGAGSTTSGHQLVYDGSGNAIDGGVPGSGGTVTSITQGTGMSFSVSPITTTGTVNLANTTVTPGSYTNTNITVDAQGRVTAAATGSGGTFFSSAAATAGGPVTYTLAMSGYVATSGNYVCTPSVNIANGANPTLNVNSTGAKPIKLLSGTGLLSLVNSEMPVSGEVCWLYDGTNYVMQTPVASPLAIGTSDTVTAAKWTACQSYVITTAAQTITLPTSTGIAPTGCVQIQTIGVTVTLTPTGASGDAINNGQVGGGAANAAITIPADTLTVVNYSGTPGLTAYTAPLGPLQYFTQTWAEGLNLSAAPRGISRFGTPKVIYGIKCNVQTAAGSASTIHVRSTATGSAPSSGTLLDTTGCDANTASNTEQDMGVASGGVGTTVAGYTIWALYSGTGTAGNGVLTITYR